MEDSLIQRLRFYIEPPASRVPHTIVSIAYLDAGDIQSNVITAGMQDPDGTITGDARFLVQSITKSFTAGIILRCVMSGQLTLDAPLSEWLVDVPNASRITIRQCLQHTSGLPDYGALPEYSEAIRYGDIPWTFVDFMTHSRANQLLFEPGHGWQYSNIGYMLLRQIIETVRGKSFAEVVEADICQPLNLHYTSVITTQDELQLLVPAYSISVSSDGQPVELKTHYDPGWIAPGVVASTASDIVRFYDGLLGGEFLPASILDEMKMLVRTSAQPSQKFVAPSYGLGLMADPASPYGVLYGHNGAGPGYTSSAFHVSSSKRNPLIVAVLSNTENYAEVELMAFTIIHALTK
ncbi:MAG: beta-lactamase family protein [Bryobacteraceae bacterium]|nr:beta-lactamase family protein [Bryobacteraceae bacterium]